jgi:hypothetical protein
MQLIETTGKSGKYKKTSYMLSWFLGVRSKLLEVSYIDVYMYDDANKLQQFALHKKTNDIFLDMNVYLFTAIGFNHWTISKLER